MAMNMNNLCCFAIVEKVIQPGVTSRNIEGHVRRYALTLA